MTATESCLAIGTLPETDGETTIVLTRTLASQPSQMELQWTGPLKTSGQLDVVTSDGKCIVHMDQVPTHVDVEVWTNDRTEPDVIWIVVKF